jgi:hypothetical protein
MTTTYVKVYPAKASALNVNHPIGGKPRLEGTEWPYDVFTCRRLSDGSFTDDASKAYKPTSESDAKGAQDAAPAAALAPPKAGDTGPAAVKTK